MNRRTLAMLLFVLGIVLIVLGLLRMETPSTVPRDFIAAPGAGESFVVDRARAIAATPTGAALS
jgi:hypothetical protein